MLERIFLRRRFPSPSKFLNSNLAETNKEQLSLMDLSSLQELHSSLVRNFLKTKGEVYNFGGFWFQRQKIKAKMRILKDDSIDKKLELYQGAPYIRFHYVPLNVNYKIKGHEFETMVLSVADFLKGIDIIKEFISSLKDHEYSPKVMLTNTNKGFASFLKKQFNFYSFISRGSGIRFFSKTQNVWFPIDEFLSLEFKNKVESLKVSLLRFSKFDNWDELEKDSRIKAILFIQEQQKKPIRFSPTKNYSPIEN